MPPASPLITRVARLCGLGPYWPNVRMPCIAYPSWPWGWRGERDAGLWGFGACGQSHGFLSGVGVLSGLQAHAFSQPWLIHTSRPRLGSPRPAPQQPPWCVRHKGCRTMAAPPIKAGPARDGTGSRCGTGTRPSRPARGRGFPQRRIVGASLTRNSTVRNPSHPDRFALVGVCKHPMRMLRGSLGPLPPAAAQAPIVAGGE
jgi:hypothetical protein